MQHATQLRRSTSPPTPKLAGGYRSMSTRQICLVWSAYQVGVLSKLLDVRVYWALHEIADRREAALRAKGRTKEKTSPFRWPRDLLIPEVQRLVGLATPAPIRASLRRLEASGLVTLAPNEIAFADALTSFADPIVSEAQDMLVRIHPRPCVRERAITFPRRMLRYLAGSGVPSLHAAVLAHLMRCLWRKGTGFSNVGLCSSRFVSDVFGVDRRNAKRARALLRNMGWLALPDADYATGRQRSAWATIDLEWMPAPNSAQQPGGTHRVISPPRMASANATSPPPIKKPDLLSGSKNQYAPARLRPGVRERTVAHRRPSLADVQPKDLRSPARLRALFQEAVSGGLVRDSVANQTRFVAAATHALRVGTRNPCGLFVAVIRKGLWNYLTQADEDAARRLLADPAWHPTAQGTRDSNPCPSQAAAGNNHSRIMTSKKSIDGLVRELSQRFSVDRRESITHPPRTTNCPDGNPSDGDRAPRPKRSPAHMAASRLSEGAPETSDHLTTRNQRLQNRCLR